MAYKQQNLFFTVLGDRKSKIKVPIDSVSGKGVLPHGSLSAVFTWWKGALWSLFFKDTDHS